MCTIIWQAAVPASSPSVRALQIPTDLEGMEIQGVQVLLTPEVAFIHAALGCRVAEP